MIPNPMNPGDPVYDMAFNFFAMEEEGLLPTHKGTLNAVCNYLPSPNSGIITKSDFEYALDQAGVDWELTSDDFDYISERTGVYCIEY